MLVRVSAQLYNAGRSTGASPRSFAKRSAEAPAPASAREEDGGAGQERGEDDPEEPAEDVPREGFRGEVGTGGGAHRHGSAPGHASSHAGPDVIIPRMSESLRCPWAGTDPLYVAYHDEEWGVPSRDDRHLFEMLVLEGAQAGLSWITILRKREGYRKAFAGFDPAKVARFGPQDVERLLGDPGIVRNRLKVESAIDSAKAFLALQKEAGSFSAWLWALRRREAGPGLLPGDAGGPGEDAPRRADLEGPPEARLPLRRPDDRLRLPAGRRRRERPPRHLPAIRESAETG